MIRVDFEEARFRRAVERYARASRKAAADAAAKQLANWCFFALRRLRGDLGATHGMVAWPRPGGRGRASANWRLVRWLATRQVAAGRAVATKGRLTARVNRDARASTGQATRVRLWVRDAKTGKVRRESLWGASAPDLAKISATERAARSQSRGYVKSLVLAAARAARARAAQRTPTGIAARPTGRASGDAFEAGVQAVYRYKSELTRAMSRRDNSGVDARIEAAFRAARADVVADIGKYLRRKLEKEARKAFAAAR